MDELVLCKDCGDFWNCHQTTNFEVRCPWFKPKPDEYLNGFTCHAGCP